MIPTDDRDAIEDLLARCENDTWLFMCSFLPEWVTPEGGTEPYKGCLHDKILDALDNDDIQKAIIQAPRGLGKTTLVLGYLIKQILFRKLKFLLFISKSGKHSKDQTEKIKEAITTNERIISVFGKLKPKRSTDIEFSKDTWGLVDPTTGKVICTIVPKGAAAQIRGSLKSINGKPERPDYIIIDDATDDETIDNEEIRKRDRKWFSGTLFRTVSQYSLKGAKGNWRIFWTDTWRHRDAPIQHFMESEGWYSEVISICDNNHISYMPELKSTEEIEKDRSEAREEGTLDAWTNEFMNTAFAEENRSFTREMFQPYFEEILDAKYPNGMDGFVLVDPANSSTAKSCFSSAVAIGVEMEETPTQERPRIYVRKVIQERWNPNEFLEAIFNKLVIPFKIPVIGVEKTGGGHWITYFFRNYIIENGLNTEIVELTTPKHVGDFGTGKEAAKRARGAGLVPFYTGMQMFHNPGQCYDLEGQLLNYPQPKYWDAMDALGHMPGMLRLGNRYFRSRHGVKEEYDFQNSYSMDIDGIPDVIGNNELYDNSEQFLQAV